MSKAVRVVTLVYPPDDATHYAGDLLDDPTWYKRKDIGAGGEHWFRKNSDSDQWLLCGHTKPHWCLTIPAEVVYG